jgi:hypothetical protein
MFRCQFCFILLTALAQAGFAQGTWTLGGGEKRTLLRDGARLDVVRKNTKQVTVECVANVITPSSPGNTTRGKCNESNALWHGATVVNNGVACAAEPEHGDAPPSWSGAVSHWQGWYNTGDLVADRFPRRAGSETSTCPVMLVVDQTSYDQYIRCEQWYANTAEWSWDFGWQSA